MNETPALGEWIDVKERVPQAPLDQILVKNERGERFITYVRFWAQVTDPACKYPPIVSWTILP